MKNLRLFLHKLIHWEYWPYQVLYTPIYFQYLYYTFRTKSFFYFNASNPTFKNGGFFMDSKKDIYNLLITKYKKFIDFDNLAISKGLTVSFKPVVAPEGPGKAQKEGSFGIIKKQTRAIGRLNSMVFVAKRMRNHND